MLSFSFTNDFTLFYCEFFNYGEKLELDKYSMEG